MSLSPPPPPAAQTDRRVDPAALAEPGMGGWPVPAALQASAVLHVGAAAAALGLPGAAPWAGAAVVLNHLALTAAGLWPRSRWLGPNITRLPEPAAARGQIALTLDDGPDPAVTPAVLDLLAEHGVKATFFCIADRARQHPALLRRILEQGHEVGNHSLYHRHHFSLRGPRALMREVGGAQALLADLGGVWPLGFRAPAGLRNPFLDPVLHRLGLHLVSWTRRGFDTRCADASTVVQRLSRGLRGGDILLLHDGHAQRDADGQPLPLAVLPPLLARCRQAGLTPVTLRQALPARHAPVGALP